MDKWVTIKIDGREVAARSGEKLLFAALRNGIFIPHLCALPGVEPAAGCRLCFVEIEGREQPVTSCTEPVQEGMAVRTRSPRVDRLVGAAFALIMSEHRLSCADCPGRKRCVLLKIARERKLRLRPVRFKKLVRPAVIDESLKTIVFDRSHCVLCGHCIWACRELAHVGALGFSQRGYRRVVTTFGDRPLADSPCLECGECVKVCPVGAISFKAGLEQKKRQNDRSGR